MVQGSASTPAKPASLDEVVRQIDTVSSIPQVALRVVEVANDPDAGAGDMKRVMEVDPALCTRVLQHANSAAMALRIRTTNLQQAISLLGLKQIRNLAVTAKISQLFAHDTPVNCYRPSILWRHLVAVATGARMLGLRLKFRHVEDLYLAGLLHDIGILLEAQFVPLAFAQAMQNIDPAKSLVENEHRFLGFDHTQLGLRVAEKWGLGESLKAAIAFHHRSNCAAGPALELVQFVEVANVLCSAKDITSVGINLVRPVAEVMAAIGLGREDLVAVVQELDGELLESAALMSLT